MSAHNEGSQQVKNGKRPVLSVKCDVDNPRISNLEILAPSQQRLGDACVPSLRSGGNRGNREPCSGATANRGLATRDFTTSKGERTGRQHRGREVSEPAKPMAMRVRSMPAACALHLHWCMIACMICSPCYV